MAYGYGLSATPLQIAQAYAALGNGGKLIAPTFVKGERHEPVQVLDPAISGTIMRMMRSWLASAAGSSPTNAPSLMT